MNLSPSHFFDVSRFEHSQLFSCEYVWQALANLPSYLQTVALGDILTEIPPGVTLVHPELIFIAKGCYIEPGAYIKGPCVIGEGSEIRHAAYIRGHVVIGRGCVIGHASEIKNAIFLDGASAAHFAYVGNSILGNRVNLGAGVKCANLRLDRQPIVVKTPSSQHSTEMRKLGSIVGDDAQVGCNSVLNPGTLLEKCAICSPCLSFSGVVHSATAKRRDQ